MLGAIRSQLLSFLNEVKRKENFSDEKWSPCKWDCFTFSGKNGKIWKSIFVFLLYCIKWDNKIRFFFFFFLVFRPSWVHCVIKTDVIKKKSKNKNLYKSTCLCTTVRMHGEVMSKCFQLWFSHNFNAFTLFFFLLLLKCFCCYFARLMVI